MIFRFGAVAALVLASACTGTTTRKMVVTTGSITPAEDLVPTLPPGLSPVAVQDRAAAEQINVERRKAGLSDLKWSAELARAAAAQASDMAARGYFDHVSPEGSTPGARVRAAGYPACWTAENLSWGRATAAEVTARWMDSPGHRANILSRDMTHVGVARAGGPTWVAVFAAPC